MFRLLVGIKQIFDAGKKEGWRMAEGTLWMCVCVYPLWCTSNRLLHQKRIIFHPSEIAVWLVKLGKLWKRTKGNNEERNAHFIYVCLYSFFVLMIKANKNVFYFEKQRLHYEIFSGCEVETTHFTSLVQQ